MAAGGKRALLSIRHKKVRNYGHHPRPSSPEGINGEKACAAKRYACEQLCSGHDVMLSFDVWGLARVMMRIK